MGSHAVVFGLSQAQLFNCAHLALFALWYGAIFWVSYVGGIIMFKNMTRVEFSNIQSKLFPAYFMLGNICGAGLLGTYLYVHPYGPETFNLEKNFVGTIEISCLILMLVLNFLEFAWIGPVTTSILSQRNKAEKDGNEQLKIQLQKKFSMYHGINSLLNLIVFIAANVYLFTLGKKMDDD